MRLGNPDKSTVAIIGDSLKADIMGGKSYGLTTFYFDPLHKSDGSTCCADYTVYDLESIKSILS